MDLCNPKEIKALLGRHGFHFSKSKGQNFLIQSWVPQQAAEASGAAPGVGVREIGPGIGPLAAQRAQRGEKVAAVELDATLLPILAETMAPYPNVEIVPGDILKLDLPAFCREHFPGLPVVVCANLPYNITTPVITALLQSQCFQAVTVIIQQGQRAAAQGGVNGAVPAPSQLGAYACFQFLQGERLGHIIVGAGLEQIDLMLYAAFCGNDDDRHIMCLADLMQDLAAVCAWKHQIHQDEVRACLSDMQKRFGAGIRILTAKPAFFQIFVHHHVDGAVIFHDQYRMHSIPSFP